MFFQKEKRPTFATKKKEKERKTSQLLLTYMYTNQENPGSTR